ncbi:MAG TPA: hypothetical protein VKZ97_05155, partial [Flavobacteriaceae bacterium]|nr:hypothetical protein [Flavobacteriaceae bacterium]
GMVPNLVTGVWVGAEDRAAHFASITYGQGASMALPIWGMYMKSCYEDEELNVSQSAFEAPKELSIEVNCQNYVPDQDGGSSLPDGEMPDELDFG